MARATRPSGRSRGAWMRRTSRTTTTILRLPGGRLERSRPSISIRSIPFRTMDSVQGASAAILGGFLGNVARSAKTAGDLRVVDKGGATILFQNHENGGA